MPRARSILAVLALVALPVAGCLAGPTAPSQADPTPGNASRLGDIGPHPGETAHVHDRWDGDRVKTLISETVQIERSNRWTATGDPVNYVGCELECDHATIFAPDDGRIVPPGTARVVVNATWDGGGEVKLAYRAADASRFVATGRQASPATWTINTTVPMADGGHALRSLWQFRLVSCESCVAVVPPGSQAFPVDVTATAHRVDGDLPKEPPHPDWWNDGPVRQIHEVAEQGGFLDAGVQEVPLTGSSSAFVNGTDHGIVPFGTEVLVLEVNWTGDGSAPGAVRPYARWDTDMRHPMRSWDPDIPDDGRYVFTLPVPANRTDGMYADRSRWWFRIDLAGTKSGVSGPGVGELHEPTYWQGSWEATIRAFNTTELPDRLAGTG